MIFKAQISLELNYQPPDGSIRGKLFGIAPSTHGIIDDGSVEMETKFQVQSNKLPRRGSRMSLPGFKHENGGLQGSLLSLPTINNANNNNQRKTKSAKYVRHV